jgi:hypothetical protein
MENNEFFVETTTEQPKKRIPKVSIEDIKKEDIENLVAQIDTNKILPNGYLTIPIDSTNGKMFSPTTLHFRNFYVEDIKELVQYTDSIALFQRLISVLTKMNYENFDCGKLHIEELKEIMIKLYLNYISKYLKNMKYRINESLPLEGDNIGYTNIDLSKLDIIPISDKVKGTFTLRVKDSQTESVTFNFPTVDSIVLANKIVSEIIKKDKDVVDIINKRIEENDNNDIKLETINKRLAQIEIELQKDNLLKEQIETYNLQKMILSSDLSRTNQQLELNKVSEEDEAIVDTFENNRKILYIEVYQKLAIDKINGKELSVYEKVESKIDFRYFILYNEVISKNKFGISNDVTFFCPHNKESVTRAFPFQLTDFILTMGTKFDTEYSIDFS